MSRYRFALFGIAALFATAASSAAYADCCGWGVQAPVFYASAGCGGCGTPTVYVQPVVTTPVVTVAPRTWSWATGCNCERPVFYARVPIAPAPIYVINQGPYYTGPGIMVPYHTWSPVTAYIGPGSYPYYGYRYGYRHRYGAYGYRYGWHRHFVTRRMHVWYHPRVYGRPYYHRPLRVWRPAPHRYYR